MKNFKAIIFILLFFTSITIFAQDKKTVKYVFLFIADGLSFSHKGITDAYLEHKGKDKLCFSSFPIHGIMTTFAANQLITDSAASGTAIACGVKTNVGYIGVDTLGNKQKSIATVAKERGKKVGIISSVQINHATPAVFYSHNISRSNTYDIALDLLNSKFDFFAGGSFIDMDGKKSKNNQGNFWN